MFIRLLARLLLLILSLFGFSPTQGNRLDKINAFMNQESRCVQECVDALVPALQSRDAAAVKALFAENVISEHPELDAQIQAMLSHFDGEMEWHADSDHGGSRVHYGEKSSFADIDLCLITGGKSWYLRSRLTYEHNRDAGEIGLCAMLFIPAGAFSSVEHFTPRDEDRGLFIEGDDPDAPEGGFVGGYAMTWLDRDAAPVTEEALKAFLSGRESVTRDEFEAEFGSPALGSTFFHDWVYVMPPVDGEPRFAKLGFLNDVLKSVYLCTQWDYIFPPIWEKQS